MGMDFTQERVALEFKKFGQQIAVDAGILAEMHFTVGQDAAYSFLRDEIMVRMVAKILVDDLPPERVTQSTMITVKEPASTWQMWKMRNGDRWFARWLVDRRPVRYHEYKRSVQCEFDLERFRAYPQARVTAPVLGKAVMFHTIRDVVWDDGKEEYHG